MADAKKWTGRDSRGKRTMQSDSRVPDSAKADMPAYGFDGMTVGDILDEKDRVNKERDVNSHKWKGWLK